MRRTQGDVAVARASVAYLSCVYVRDLYVYTGLILAADNEDAAS